MSIDPETEKSIAKTLFNHVWTLIQSEARTPVQDDEMEWAAMASLYHWSKVGDAGNLAIGQWQVAHVYLRLGRLEEAKRYAQKVIETCMGAGLGDFYLAYSYLELARALRSEGKEGEAHAYALKAKETPMADPHDQEHFDQDFKSDGWAS